jgi:hypothetical protein
MKNSLLIILAIAVFFVSCEEKEENPQLSTEFVKPLSSKRFYVKAQVIKKGNIPVNDYGFAYYVGSGNYQSGSETKVSLGKSFSADTFSTNIAVNMSQGYYSSSNLKVFVRAYITNEKGTLYAKPASAEFLLSQILQVTPLYGKAGDTITIRGNNLDPFATNSAVTFNNTPGTIVEATTSQIRVIVPGNIQTNSYDSYVSLKVANGNGMNDYTTNFSLSPTATSFTPKSGTWGTNITIYGSNLYNAKVYFGEVQYSGYSSQNNSITVSIPSNLFQKSFKLYVEKNGQKTEVPGGTFTMNKLIVSSFSPHKLMAGSTLSIYGANFNSYSDNNKLHIGNQIISTYSSSSSSLIFTLPGSFAKGSYVAYLSNQIDTVLLPGTVEIVYPEITSITPTSGYSNSKLTITGKNLYTGYSATTLYFDNYTNTAYVNDSTTVKGTVPGIEPGTYTVYINAGNLKIKCPETFTILAPKLTSITPTTGAASTSVIIQGEGFGSSISNVYVYFGSLVAYPMSISNDSINVKVPSGVTSGTWMVKVSVNGYTLPSSLTFNVP